MVEDEVTRLSNQIRELENEERHQDQDQDHTIRELENERRQSTENKRSKTPVKTIPPRHASHRNPFDMSGEDQVQVHTVRRNKNATVSVGEKSTIVMERDLSRRPKREGRSINIDEGVPALPGDESGDVSYTWHEEGSLGISIMEWVDYPYGVKMKISDREMRKKLAQHKIYDSMVITSIGETRTVGMSHMEVCLV